MSCKYHSATFTESAFLDSFGMGDELTTKLEGRYSGTITSTKPLKPNPFISITEKTIKNAKISYNGKAIKLQEIFDAVHKVLPVKSFTIQELTLIRQVKEFDEYLLKDIYPTYEFKYKTFGFKQGVFDRFGAITSPCELINKRFKKKKQRLKDTVPKKIYKRVKDCVLMNNNTYTIKDLRKLFLDMDYMMLLEEKEGHFVLRDFAEV